MFSINFWQSSSVGNDSVISQKFRLGVGISSVRFETSHLSFTAIALDQCVETVWACTVWCLGLTLQSKLSVAIT